VRGGRLWRDQGVSRLILGRETSIRDAGLIKRETGLEVELFIHGSMCMAYSGNCTISNYTQGRDSNRGGCAQSCRFSYELKSLDSQKTVSNSFFMSSKDLMGVSEIPLFVEEKIDSLKIEGRMRSPLYAATVTKIYRESLDRFFNEGQLSPEFLDGVGRELELVPHRDYTDASLVDPAGENSVYTGGGRDKKKEQLYLGVVRQVIDERYFLVETKLGFSEGETLELLRPTGDAFAFKAISLQDCVGEERAKINPNVLVRIPYVKGVSVGQILRKVGFV
jgi:putative protease